MIEFSLVGNGLYPTLCLFNHSCDNNTYKYFAGSKLIAVASKVSHITYRTYKNVI